MEQSIPSVVINPSRDPSTRGGAPGSTFTEPGDSGFTTRRCYMCSFCGRECRNAQALGGHMNVHRRERAMANQLVELRNQAGNKGAAASSNPSKGCMIGEPEQDVITHACDKHGGSSSSSSSPPSSESFTSSIVHPWRSLQLPVCELKPLARCDSVDLELRLGLTPDRI